MLKFLEFKDKVSAKKLIDFSCKITSLNNKVSANKDYEEYHYKISQWIDFTEEVDRFYRELDDEEEEYLYPDTKDKTVDNEKSLENCIFDILEHVFNENLCSSDYRFKLSTKEDIYLESVRDKEQKLLSIEIKQDSVFKNIKNESIIAKYKMNSQIKSCLNQIIHYMKKNNCNYGILTSFEKSWFLHKTRDTQDNQEELFLISDMIESKFFLRSIYYVISKLKD